MIVRHLLKSMRRDQQGTTAVEFALVAPVFIALLVGTIALCICLFLVGSLHYAVEEGARCASVKTACADASGNPDAIATVAYAQSHYFGPAVSPTFTYTYDATAGACGNKVSGSINYSINVGFKTFVVPISASACFP
jgi:Flp pilus assembly protein TadG